MSISLQELQWLGSLQTSQPTAKQDQLNDSNRAKLSALMMDHTPAWSQPYLRLDARIQADPCPQVVGLDFPGIGLTAARWVDGALFLSLMPLESCDNNPTWTGFSIKGAEPRLWDLSAPNGTTVEVTSTGIHVRTRFEQCDLIFTPGSY